MGLILRYQGRRYTVPVLGNTLMKDILQSGLDHFKITSSNMSLTHHGIPIDLTLPFRLSGLFQNTLLEMEKSFNSKIGNNHVNVRIAIQRGKTRVQENVRNDLLLKDMLSMTKWTLEKNETLQFLQRVFTKKEMEELSLLDLGIRGGSAMFRVVNTKEEEEKIVQDDSKEEMKSIDMSTEMEMVEDRKEMEKVDLIDEMKVDDDVVKGTDHNVGLPSVPIVCVVEKEKNVVEEKMEKSEILSHGNDMEIVDSTIKESEILSLVSENDMMEEVEEKSMDTDVSLACQKVACREALTTLENNTFDTNLRVAVMKLMHILVALINKPKELKVRKIRLGNVHFDASIGKLEGGITFLNAVGFTRTLDTLFLTLKAENEDEALIRSAMDMLYSISDELDIPSNQRPLFCPPPQYEEFNPYEVKIVRTETQPRGPLTTDVKLENLKQKKNKLLDLAPPLRQVMVFLQPPVRSRTVESSALGETSDGGLLRGVLQRQKLEAKKAQNFQTKAMREFDVLSKQRVFAEVIVRLQFPDRVTLQAHFHPKETVQVLYDVVQQALKPEFQSMSFYLFTSPPVHRLLVNSTLQDAKLVPAALVYVSWESDKPVGSYRGEYLLEDLIMDKKPDGKGSESYPTSTTLAPDNTKKQDATTSSKTGKAKKGLPKWFKL